jgi:hypothetical protein
MATSEDLERIIRYAKSHCEDRCPADRDPETCLALIDMCRSLKVDPPMCLQETNGFTKSYFQAKIREIEKKWGKPISEVLAGFQSNGVKTLEENIDKMEAEFAVSAVKAINARAKKQPHDSKN